MTNILLLLSIAVVGLQYEVSANFQVIDGHTYFISTPMRKNWYQATRDCLQKNMHLADPRTQDENEIILHLLRVDFNENSSLNKNTTNYWIGGTDLGSHGTYYWASNGDELGFDYFKVGYPDQLGVEHCVEYHTNFDFKWNDNTCEKSQYFLCRSKAFTPIYQDDN